MSCVLTHDHLTCDCGIIKLHNIAAIVGYLQPGIAYSLTYKDKVLFSGGLGVTVKNKNGEPNGTTIFRIGSVSKVFAVSYSVIVYQCHLSR